MFFTVFRKLKIFKNRLKGGGGGEGENKEGQCMMFRGEMLAPNELEQSVKEKDRAGQESGKKIASSVKSRQQATNEAIRQITNNIGSAKTSDGVSCFMAKAAMQTVEDSCMMPNPCNTYTTVYSAYKIISCSFCFQC